LSTRKQTVSIFPVPPPVGGINVRDPANRLPQTDASYIYNWYPLQSSLLARGLEVTARDLTGTQGIKGFFNWVNDYDVDTCILTTDSKIFVLADPSTPFVATDITSPVTITNGATNAAPFNGYLFVVNGTDPVIRVDRSPACTNPGFTGPSPDDSVLSQVCAYRNRLYFVEKSSLSIWYGGVDFVSGALTELDLSSVFESPSNLMFVTAWTTNQGNQNEELLVVVSRRGEVLLYSGDNPEAANWQLIGRTFIPTVLGPKAFCKLGNDLIIYTKLGPVPLSSAISSGALPSDEYNISSKILKAFASFAFGADGNFPMDSNRAVMVRDEILPILYVNAEGVIYTLNYQTGAWAIFDVTTKPETLCYAFGNLMLGKNATPEITYIQPILGTASAGSYPDFGLGTNTGSARSLITGWLNLGREEVMKKIVAIRLYSAVPVSSLTTSSTYTITVYSGLQPAYQSASDTKTITVTASGSLPGVTEFRPNATPATWFQFDVSVASGGSADEFLGMDIEFEELGGAY
jgi:hypothetical protein